jgi:drug/metabolite transporter (DMT)-like permease
MPTERKPLDATAFSLMVLCTALWGFQQVAIKLTAADVSLVMQAGIRSIIATVLVLLWVSLKGVNLWEKDKTLLPGIVAGLLFGIEFVFIYGGLGHTSASRMVVFVYLAPILTALGVHALVPGEKLNQRQWAGVLLAFIGIAYAFYEGKTALGDLSGILGALFWAATTVLIRATRLARASATKTLTYQLGVSALVLPVASWLMGERGVVAVTPLAVASLAFQGVIVAFASYLAWFWLLTRYLAGRLAVFSFLTPLFGVLFGVLILDEPLTVSFVVAALLVAAGIVLVNAKN